MLRSLVSVSIFITFLQWNGKSINRRASLEISPTISASRSENFNGDVIRNHNEKRPPFIEGNVIFRPVYSFNAIHIDGDFWLSISSMQLLANISIYMLIDRDLFSAFDVHWGSLWDQRHYYIELFITLGFTYFPAIEASSLISFGSIVIAIDKMQG